MENSQFRLVSYGIVAEDKNKGSKFISVYPIESLPFYEGEVTVDVVDVERKGKDASGKEYRHTLQKGGTVKAEWIGGGNRVTSPSVRKGERVKLFQAGNTERYRWDETGLDNHLRRTEAVTYAFKASKTPVSENEIPDAGNNYTVSIDGEEGHITIKTSKANGEKSGFTIQINGKDGFLTFTDERGNMAQINGPNDTLYLKNKNGSFIKIKGDECHIECKESVKIKTKSIILDGDVVITKSLSVKEEIKCPKSDLDVVNSKIINATKVNSVSCY